jgi:DivIVA domain-containing protein
MAWPDPRPSPLRPADVATQEFTLARRGYDPEEVRSFLARLAEQLARLQGEIEWQRARTEHLERRTAAAQESAYARLSRDFMEVVRRADEASARVRAEAEARAAGEVAAARQEAERIVAQARLDARQAYLDAEREAAATRGEVPPAPAVPEDPWPAEDLVIDTSSYDAWELDAIWNSAVDPLGPRSEEGPMPDAARAATPSDMPDDPFGDLEVSIDPALFDLFDATRSSRPSSPSPRWWPIPRAYGTSGSATPSWARSCPPPARSATPAVRSRRPGPSLATSGTRRCWRSCAARRSRPRPGSPSWRPGSRS